MDRLENLLGAQAVAIAGRVHDEVAGGAGTPPSAAAALVTLLAYPDEPQHWLAGVLGLGAPGTSRLVDRLAADGLVERGGGRDGRTQALRLTARGRRAARRVLAARGRALETAAATLDDEERATLERLLHKVVSGLADDRRGGLRVCCLCDRDACTGEGVECPLQHTVH